MLKALGGSPGSSISGDDMLMESDLADPVHDDSLLEELFYKDVSKNTLYSEYYIIVYKSTNKQNPYSLNVIILI